MNPAMEKTVPADRKCAYRLLLAAVVLMILTPYLAPRLSPETALGVAALACLLAIAIIRSGAPRFDWFHPLSMFVANFFLLFVANGVIILLGISHILTAIFGPAPDTVYELMNRATLYASGFLLTVYAGYLFRRQRAGRRTQLAGAFPEQFASPNSMQFRRLRIAAWLALGCSYAGCAILTVIFGGIGNFIGSPMTIIESRGEFWPIVLIWASLWSFGIFYIGYVRERKRMYLFSRLSKLGF